MPSLKSSPPTLTTQTDAAGPVATATAAPKIDMALRIQILVESAMSHSRFSDSDAQLVIRQLAAELVKIDASLSDVRLAVQTLYKEDKAGAQAYLAYLEENGFPKREQIVSDGETSAETSAENSPAQNIEQDIAKYVEKPVVQKTASSQQDIYKQATNRPQSTQPFVANLSPSANAAIPNRACSLYGNNLITELVSNSAYSSLLFGERRSGTSALLRAIIYDQIAKSSQTILDIVDLHSGQWGGLEDIRLDAGDRMVNYYTLSTPDDIESVSRKLISVEAEVRRRQQSQQAQRLSLSLRNPVPYLFLIDGLSELLGALPGWTPDRRSKHDAFSRLASSLRFVLSHGPAVGMSCVATARSHSSCPCDISALSETKLLFLGRVSGGRNGGYRAVDAVIEDKTLLPSSLERTRFRELLAAAKQLAVPVVFTPNGIPRLGRLGNFGSYLSVDLLAHYQYALEGGMTR